MLTIAQLHAADGLEKKIRIELAETGGTWWGPGADRLGLATGDPVDTEAFLDLYTGFREPPTYRPSNARPWARDQAATSPSPTTTSAPFAGYAGLYRGVGLRLRLRQRR